MFRKPLAALAAALGLVTVACGGGSSPTPAADAGSLSIASWQWTEPGRGDAVWNLFQEFGKAHPKVELKQESVPFPRYEDTVFTQLGAHQGPDVLILDSTMLPRAMQANLLAPLAAPASGTSLVPQNEDATRAGKRYGYVWEGIGYSLMYNKALFSQAGLQPPTNVSELVADARKLTNKDTGVYGFAFRQTMQEASGWWYDLSNWCYGFGGRWSDAKGQPTINASQNVECVKAYKELYDSGAVPKGTDAATYRRMFAQGKLAMLIDNSAVAASVVTQNPNMRTDMGTVAPPFPAQHTSAVLEFVGVNRYGKNQHVAEEFVQFVLSKDVQSRLIVALGGSTVATGVKPPQDFIDSHPWITTYQAVTPKGYDVAPAGLQSKTAQIRTAVLEQVSRVLVQNADPKQALDAAQQQTEQLVKS